MPHIVVKLYPGRTEDQERELAQEITGDVVVVAKCDEGSGTRERGTIIKPPAFP